MCLMVLSLFRSFLPHVVNPRFPLISISLYVVPMLLNVLPDFDVWNGFCSSKLGIIIIALNALSFKGESCNHSFISLVVSSINYFLRVRMVKEINSFSSILGFRRLVAGFPQIGNCHIFPHLHRTSSVSMFPKDWLSSRVFSSVAVAVSLKSWYS